MNKPSKGTMILNQMIKPGISLDVPIRANPAFAESIDIAAQTGDHLIGPIGSRPWDRILGGGASGGRKDADAGESDRAWEAFRLYRDMGSGRTIGQVARDFGLKDHGTATGWATKYRWRERAAAWDAYLDRIAQAEYEKEAATMGRRHARIGMRLQVVGSERLQEYAEREDLKETISVGEALAITKAGVEIERQARAVDGNGGKSAGAGTIVFNFNMPAPPKWAPKSLSGGSASIKVDVPIADAEVIEEPNQDGK